MSDPLTEIEREADELWRKVLAFFDGNEGAARTVMEGHANIALDSNLRRKAENWLARNTGRTPDVSDQDSVPKEDA